MSVVNWEQKFAAICALAPASLKMRKPGDWYVDTRTERKTRGSATLESRYGNGTDPQDAVEDHWRQHTELLPDQYIVTDLGGKRRAVIWNGFMWEDVVE